MREQKKQNCHQTKSNYVFEILNTSNGKYNDILFISFANIKARS